MKPLARKTSKALLHMASGGCQSVCSGLPHQLHPELDLPRWGCNLQHEVLLLHIFQIWDHGDICKERQRRCCPQHEPAAQALPPLTLWASQTLRHSGLHKHSDTVTRGASCVSEPQAVSRNVVMDSLLAGLAICVSPGVFVSDSDVVTREGVWGGTPWRNVKNKKQLSAFGEWLL